MKLTSFSDYSLRVLIYLAAEPDRRATVSDIATTFGISEHHLVKVVHYLGRQGWVQTVRGKGGGISLAHSPSNISIGSVVRDTEGAPVPAECFSGGDTHCVLDEVCRLKGVLGEAVRAFYAVLDRYTLADVVANRQVLAGILQIHPA